MKLREKEGRIGWRKGERRREGSALTPAVRKEEKVTGGVCPPLLLLLLPLDDGKEMRGGKGRRLKERRRKDG